MSEKIPPFKKGRSFYNSLHHRPESLLFGTLPSFIQSLWHRRSHRLAHDTVRAWLEELPHVLPASHDLRITWLGHATFLIQLHGINILTDPIFGRLSRFFPRLLPVGITPQQLPSIDIVLISHNHRDHMDEQSLLFLKDINPALITLVAHGDGAWFERRGFLHVRECSWWQDYEFVLPSRSTLQSSKIRCTFLPAWHWSQRSLFDKNRSLWGSWMIQVVDTDAPGIYFAGDTAYSPHFTNIAYHFPEIDVALMPIGPCEPHDWMKHTHLSADQAVQAFVDLNASHFIPMHWGTFGFGHDHFDLPIERLQQAWQAHQELLGSKKLHLVKAGQSASDIFYE